MNKTLKQKLELINFNTKITITDLLLIRENEATKIIDEIIKACENETGRKYYHPRIRFPEDKPDNHKIKQTEVKTKQIIEALREHGSFKSLNSFALYLSTKHNYSITTAKRKINAAWAATKINRMTQIINGKETFVFTLNQETEEGDIKS